MNYIDLTSFFLLSKTKIKLWKKTIEKDKRTKSFNNQSATKNLIPDAILAVFELGASYLHQADLLTFCGSLLGQIGKKSTHKGGWGDTQG